MKYYSSFPIDAENCLNNRAINYGDGVFETMLVNLNEIPLWKFHYQRLQDGLQRLDMNSPLEQLLLEKITTLISDFPHKGKCVVKLVVFRDDSNRGYASQSKDTKFFISINSYHSTKLNTQITESNIRLATQKRMAGIKHLNRLEQVLATQELMGTTFDDAIMLNKKGRVIETISKNIILIQDNTLFTPKLNKCGVFGVALRWLMSQGYQLKWKKIEFNSLSQYDGFLVCNSIIGFQSITMVNNIQFKSDLSIIEEIQQKWHKQLNP